MKTPELKPCPFCGEVPFLNIIEPHSHVMQFGDFKMPDYKGGACVECRCGAGLMDETVEKVVAHWNTRHEVSNERA